MCKLHCDYKSARTRKINLIGIFTYPFQYIALFKLKPHNQTLIKDYLRKTINEPYYQANAQSRWKDTLLKKNRYTPP